MLSQVWPQLEHGVPVFFFLPGDVPKRLLFLPLRGWTRTPAQAGPLLDPRSLMHVRWSDRSRTLCLAPEVQKSFTVCPTARVYCCSCSRTLRPRHQLQTSQLQILPRVPAESTNTCTGATSNSMRTGPPMSNANEVRPCLRCDCHDCPTDSNTSACQRHRSHASAGTHRLH